MARWSVALMGHQKPDVEGWERRAMPGDIIAYKLAIDEAKWTPRERKEFLIVTIDGPSPEQMDALCEPLYDITKADADGHPLEHLRKRRFSIPVKDLVANGLDEMAMLDNENAYAPELPTALKTECFDKLRDRYVSDGDNLRVIDPVVTTEASERG